MISRWRPEYSVVSYDNTSNPAIVPTEFAEIRGTDWTVQDDGAGNDYQHALNEINNTPSTINFSLYDATVPLTNAVGNNFTMSAKMTILSASTNNSNNRLVAGLEFLSSQVSTGYTAELVVLGAGISGTMRISENDTVRASAPFPGGFALGVRYNLTLTATYNGANSLTMNFVLSDGSNTNSISFIDTTPQTNSRFGFRDVVGTNPQSTLAFNVHYDNLLIVPEPSTAMLLTSGLLGCIIRRRTARNI